MILSFWGPFRPILQGQTCRGCKWQHLRYFTSLEVIQQKLLYLDLPFGVPNGWELGCHQSSTPKGGCWIWDMYLFFFKRFPFAHVKPLKIGTARKKESRFPRLHFSSFFREIPQDFNRYPHFYAMFASKEKCMFLQAAIFGYPFVQTLGSVYIFSLFKLIFYFRPWDSPPLITKHRRNKFKIDTIDIYI